MGGVLGSPSQRGRQRPRPSRERRSQRTGLDSRRPGSPRVDGPIPAQPPRWIHPPPPEVWPSRAPGGGGFGGCRRTGLADEPRGGQRQVRAKWISRKQPPAWRAWPRKGQGWAGGPAPASGSRESQQQLSSPDAGQRFELTSPQFPHPQSGAMTGARSTSGVRGVASGTAAPVATPQALPTPSSAAAARAAPPHPDSPAPQVTPRPEGVNAQDGPCQGVCTPACCRQTTLLPKACSGPAGRGPGGAQGRGGRSGRSHTIWKLPRAKGTCFQAAHCPSCRAGLSLSPHTAQTWEGLPWAGVPGRSCPREQAADHLQWGPEPHTALGGGPGPVSGPEPERGAQGGPRARRAAQALPGGGAASVGIPSVRGQGLQLSLEVPALSCRLAGWLTPLGGWCFLSACAGQAELETRAQGPPDSPPGDSRQGRPAGQAGVRPVSGAEAPVRAQGPQPGVPPASPAGPWAPPHLGSSSSVPSTPPPGTGSSPPAGLCPQDAAAEGVGGRKTPQPRASTRVGPGRPRRPCS